jgi:hypothetical protein
MFYFLYLQIRSQRRGKVSDRQRSRLHLGHGRQREGTDGLAQGRCLQTEVGKVQLYSIIIRLTRKQPLSEQKTPI